MYFNNKISLTLVILAIAIAFIGGYYFPHKIEVEKIKPENHPTEVASSMEQLRIKGYKLTNPLLMTDINVESPALSGIRSKVNDYVSQLKSTQQVGEISVYFRSLNNGSWFSINPNELYNPASMNKIIFLLVFLKDSENNPALLNKRIFYKNNFPELTKQNIHDFKLKNNTFYTIRQLLTFMITYSDNESTLLLSQNINRNTYNNLFKILNISMPGDFGEYYLTVVDYAKFFRILNNATYLGPELSEYGLQLLTTSTFKDGMRSGVDKDILIAHKFGERVMGNETQMHEFGIVYIHDNPYLLGVMTKGTSLKELTNVIAEISRIVFTEYTAMLHV